jgi:ABC-type sugar transport system substrate-binding protein
MDREEGFEEVIAREYPRIQIVARQYSMSNLAKAVAAAENIFTAHPDLEGIFASTEPSSSGIALALKSRNLAGKIKFVGFDSSETMIEDLKAGVIRPRSFGTLFASALRRSRPPHQRQADPTRIDLLARRAAGRSVKTGNPRPPRARPEVLQ